MGRDRKPRRGNYPRDSNWNKNVDRRRSLRIGGLNVEKWSDQSKHDVLAAIEAENLDIF